MQMLISAIQLDQPTRAATLALLAIVIAVAARVLLGWWARRGDFELEPTDLASPRSAGPRRAWLSRLILIGWAIFAVGPIALLLARGSRADPGPWFIRILGWLGDPEARRWALNSSTTAGLALAIDTDPLDANGFDGGRSRPRVMVEKSPGCRPGSSSPSLRSPLGVGALSILWILASLADPIDGEIGRWLRSIALELGLRPIARVPRCSSWFLAAGNLPSRRGTVNSPGV